METHRADCGCLVERGIRVIPCGTAECCCLALPVAEPSDVRAAQIRTAFNARDMDTFRGLLAEDARWGDNCHNRSDIVAHFERLLNDGVRASIVETTTGPRGVACLLEVEWPDSENARPDRQSLYQVYVVTDGYVTEIQGHDDQESALAAIST